jgi:hypothetical protein
LPGYLPTIRQRSTVPSWGMGGWVQEVPAPGGWHRL